MRPLEFGFSVDTGGDRDRDLSVVIPVAIFVMALVICPEAPYTKKTQMPNAVR